MRVRYHASFATNTGYSQAATDNAMALLKAGVDLDLKHLPDGQQEGLQKRYAKLLDVYEKKPYDWPTHVIVHTTPRPAPTYIAEHPPGVKKICYTAWETDKLPSKDADALNQSFDLIIVPSQFCHDSFMAGGVDTEKLRVLPHCFDPNWWWDQTQTRDGVCYGIPKDPDPNGPYTFYNVGPWNIRKNQVGLLTAYWTEFYREENVRLRLVCGVTQNVMRELELLKKVLNLPHYAPVEFIDSEGGWAAAEDYRSIHYTSHCYATCTRGEGFGLGSFEAAIVGNPVIVPDWSGHLDYLDDYEGSRLFDGNMTPCAQIRLGIDGTQYWFEPDLEGFQDCLRNAFEVRLERSFRSNHHEIEANYGYKSIGAWFKKLLEEV